MLLALALSFVAPHASARCACRCVGGAVEAICTSAVDVRPVCAPAVCPVVPPAVPPVGARECRPEQVFNPATLRYEWRQICR